jgi:hypothetical protein
MVEAIIAVIVHLWASSVAPLHASVGLPAQEKASSLMIPSGPTGRPALVYKAVLFQRERLEPVEASKIVRVVELSAVMPVSIFTRLELKAGIDGNVGFTLHDPVV